MEEKAASALKKAVKLYRFTDLAALQDLWRRRESPSTMTVQTLARVQKADSCDGACETVNINHVELNNRVKVTWLTTDQSVREAAPNSWSFPVLFIALLADWQVKLGDLWVAEDYLLSSGDDLKVKQHKVIMTAVTTLCSQAIIQSIECLWRLLCFFAFVFSKSNHCLYWLYI